MRLRPTQRDGVEGGEASMHPESHSLIDLTITNIGLGLAVVALWGFVVVGVAREFIFRRRLRRRLSVTPGRPAGN